MFGKLAEELRTARELAQLTQEKTAEMIRMDLNFLKRMEQGDFSFLPELYVKAFLKDYAKIVRLDPNLVLRKYESAKSGGEIEHIPAEGETGQTHEKPPLITNAYQQAQLHPIIENDPSRYEDQTRFKSYRLSDNVKRIIGISAILLCIIAAAIYIFFLRNTPQQIVMDRPLDQIIQEQERYEEPPAEIPAVKTSDSLSLKMTFNDTCRVQMVIDSTFQRHRTYLPKEILNQKAAATIKVTINNYSAVNIFINKEPYSIVKQKSRSIQLLITKNGITQIK